MVLSIFADREVLPVYLVDPVAKTALTNLGSQASPEIVQYGAKTGTDRSGSFGTTATQLAPANASRARLFVQNDSATNVWINFGGTATAAAGSGNFKIAAGAYRDFVNTGEAVSIISEAAATAITAREY